MNKILILITGALLIIVGIQLYFIFFATPGSIGQNVQKESPTPTLVVPTNLVSDNMVKFINYHTNRAADSIKFTITYNGTVELIDTKHGSEGNFDYTSRIYLTTEANERRRFVFTPELEKKRMVVDKDLKPIKFLDIQVGDMVSIAETTDAYTECPKGECVDSTVITRIQHK